MEEFATLGVPAHRGGVLVRWPGASVGLVSAVSRTSGLVLELLARQPLDRRTALERQRDIRERRGGPATRVPPGDDDALRVGWRDGDGRAHRVRESVWTTDSGDDHDGEFGPSRRAAYWLPPVHDRLDLVLGWPSLGLPDTAVAFPLPGREEVARGTASIWDAPVLATPTTGEFEERFSRASPRVAVEEGAIAVAQRVLHRGEHAVLVLGRLATVGPDLLSLGLVCVARGEVARELSAATSPPGADPDHEPRVAVLHDGVAHRAHASHGSWSGGGDALDGTREFVLERHGDVADLLVSWPPAGLAPARVRVPLDPA
ncbi:hypothetical protein [Saccharothrix sp. Mg75]|uniref:hypothetical protein n=1 Tax=Saccharothrix sp. Mg75 TaxID=3445357 RepID=UPI003EEBE653